MMKKTKLMAVAAMSLLVTSCSAGSEKVAIDENQEVSKAQSVYDAYLTEISKEDFNLNRLGSMVSQAPSKFSGSKQNIDASTGAEIIINMSKNDARSLLDQMNDLSGLDEMMDTSELNPQKAAAATFLLLISADRHNALGFSGPVKIDKEIVSHVEEESLHVDQSKVMDANDHQVKIFDEDTLIIKRGAADEPWKIDAEKTLTEWGIESQ